MENKKWYSIINFYSLVGLLLIWISSWLFLIPINVVSDVPVFDNIWGSLFSVFGIVKKSSRVVSQTPDLLSGLFSVLFIIFMQWRGIFSVTNTFNLSQEDEKSFRLLIVLLNILSLIVYTLFFAILFKVFLFPNDGLPKNPFMENAEFKFGLALFVAFCIGAMLFSVKSIAKLFFVILVLVAFSSNIKFVSDYMGFLGFIALLFAIIGIYLNLSTGEFNSQQLKTDFKILSGKYNEVLNQSEKEIKSVKKKIKKL